MTSNYTPDISDQPLIRQFVRLFGHRPTPRELQQYERARSGISAQLPARMRRRAARMLTRV
ncbi:hypothetical protein GCM10009798_19340 [Nocardioides panacihumi]|uniref:DUF3263 domain-containing protein n=1 Tax=Nocardioides panacihumi TaxID=400774 RepID=A0ABP5C8N6_9ACTN